MFWISALNLLYALHFPLFSVATLIDKNDFKWKECKKHADKTRTRLKLESAYWHVRDCGICCWEIIYGKLCPELIASECIFHGTIYSFHWWTGASRKEPFETIWRNKKILMWLDLEQFQRRYWYFRGPERHICSETIKRSRNWAFIELFFPQKMEEGLNEVSFLSSMVTNYKTPMSSKIPWCILYELNMQKTLCWETFIQTKQSFSVMRTSFFKWCQNVFFVGQAAGSSNHLILSLVKRAEEGKYWKFCPQFASMLLVNHSCRTSSPVGGRGDAGQHQYLLDLRV